MKNKNSNKLNFPTYSDGSSVSESIPPTKKSKSQHKNDLAYIMKESERILKLDWMQEKIRLRKEAQRKEKKPPFKLL